MQFRFKEEGYKLLFIDEFTINLRLNSAYGWGPRGWNGFIETNSQGFWMFFTIGVSEDRVHGILGNRKTNDSDYLLHFLENIYFPENIDSEGEINKFMIVWDNCSIHKSNKVKDYIKETKIRILNICPYWPSLNPAEKMILYIKNKIKCIYLQSR